MIDVIETQIKQEIENITLTSPDDNNGVPENRVKVFSGTYEDVDSFLTSAKAEVTQAVVVTVTSGRFDPISRPMGIMNFDVEISVYGNYKYQKEQTLQKPRCSSIAIQIIKYLNEYRVLNIGSSQNCVLQIDNLQNQSNFGYERFTINQSIKIGIGGRQP